MSMFDVIVWVGATLSRGARWMGIPTHFHRDPNFILNGSNFYYQCKCGARRVERGSYTFVSPVARGWPALQNSHRMQVNKTAWTMPPENGWETVGYPPHSFFADDLEAIPPSPFPYGKYDPMCDHQVPIPKCPICFSERTDIPRDPGFKSRH